MKSRLIAIVGVFVLAAVGTLYAISNPGQAELKGTGDAAAWIQAWWSIAAIAIAIAYPGIEAELKAQDERRRNMRVLREIVEGAESLLADAAERFHAEQEDEFNEKLDVFRWQASKRALQEFPILRLATEQEITDLIMVRYAADRAAHIVRYSPISTTGNDRLIWRDSLSDITDIYEEARERIVRLKQLGSARR